MVRLSEAGNNIIVWRLMVALSIVVGMPGLWQSRYGSMLSIYYRLLINGKMLSIYWLKQQNFEYYIIDYLIKKYVGISAKINYAKKIIHTTKQYFNSKCKKMINV